MNGFSHSRFQIFVKRWFRKLTPSVDSVNRDQVNPSDPLNSVSIQNTYNENRPRVLLSQNQTTTSHLFLSSIPSLRFLPYTQFSRMNENVARYAFRRVLSEELHIPMNIPASQIAIDNLAHIYTDKQIDCCICCNSISRDYYNIQMPCGHEFHRCCLVQWLNTSNKCPLCRYELEKDTYQNHKEKCIIDMNDMMDQTMDSLSLNDDDGYLDFAKLMVQSVPDYKSNQFAMGLAVIKSLKEF